MVLSYQFCIPHDEVLDEWFHASNDLYNQALYVFYQRLERENIWTFGTEMYHIMKDMPSLNGTVNFRRMKAKTSAKILHRLDLDIKSYCRTIKDWKLHPDKYKGMPKKPKYKKRGGMSSFSLSGQDVPVKKEGFILFTKDKFIYIPQWKKYSSFIKEERVKEVIFLPLSDRVKVVICYEFVPQVKLLDKNSFAAIDLGVNNFVAMVTPFSAMLYNGKGMKSYNRFYTIRRATYQRIKDIQGIKGSTKRLKKISEKRNRFLLDYCHKVSKHVVNHLLEYGVGNLVVGYNVGIKQSLNLGKKVNGRISQTPFTTLRNCLRYKCEFVGLNYIEHEESFTSKCDALAAEPIGKHNEYMGKRVKRGLFQSSTKKLVNADINGALNILRKVVDDSYVKRIIDKGFLYHPTKINIV